MKNFLKKIYFIIRDAKFEVYKYFIFPMMFDKTYKTFSEYKIKSIEETAKELLNTNKSIGRFGDGELSWMFGRNNGINNFQQLSKELSDRLIEVFNSDDDNFMVTLPDAMKYADKNNFTSDSMNFWKWYLIKNKKRLLNNLNPNKVYYNTSVTRPYMDYNYNKIANLTYGVLKEIWNDKKILIIEGSESRLGVTNSLFDNAKEIKRIECPSTNAFEAYDKIFSYANDFLNANDDYLTLVSLGPTATILSYDLFKNNHRCIDIGHIDVEYEWYLMGAKEKVNLPYKYVNEVNGGHSSLPVNDSKYFEQIIKNID